MKLLRKTLSAATALAMVAGIFFGLGGVAKAAACQFQYTNTNFQTSTTPVFNSICNVPTQFSSTDGQYAFGDETDFVRIRANVSGDDTSNKNNPKLVGSTLASACNAGDKFDVLTYIHNDASQDFNNNGSGSAVAHNVKLAIDAAGIGTTNSQFTFTSTVSASNAASVTDSAMLNCNGKQVKLTLVPNSVHYNSSFDFSTTWGNMPDSAVNGTTKLGSPTWGSGDQWGCWEYLTAVVYQVKVEQVPVEKPSTGVCTAPDVTADNRTLKVTVNGSTQNATIVGYEIDFGDGATSSNQTASHTYAKSVTKATVVTRVKVKFANGTTKWVSADVCNYPVSFKTTPPPTTPPITHLPSTGASGMIGLFAAVTGAGALAHRLFLGRRLGRQ